MATRRFRIKAVANVSVSRGRCGEKSRENEKLDEKTLSNSSTSTDSQDVSPCKSNLAVCVNDNSLDGKLSGDSSSSNTLENTSVHQLLENSEYVSEPACLEANGGDCSTPVDTPSVVSCDLAEQVLNPVIQHSGNCVREEVSLCDRTDVITGSTDENNYKTEEFIESERSGNSTVVSPQKIDTTENKIPSAPIRLPRKRMKPTVSLSLLNRKVNDNCTQKITQQCSSLSDTLEEAVAYPITQICGDVSEPTTLGANDNDRSTSMDVASIVDYHLLRHPESVDTQQSDDCDANNVSLSDRTKENITTSTCEVPSSIEESIDSLSLEESCGTSDQKIEKTETKIPVASLRLPRKRLKPAVSLSLVNKKMKENLTVDYNPVCHSVQNSANVSEPKCLEEKGSDSSITENASVFNCDVSQDPGCAGNQLSDNCDSKNLTHCDRTSNGITVSMDEHCSKIEESIDSVMFGESCATSDQKINTSETKIPAASIRLPRKRLKPAVSLSLVNKKMKDNLTVDNKPVCHLVQNSANFSEPKCLEENGSDCSITENASVVNCDVSQDPGCAVIQLSDNCDSKNLAHCDRLSNDITVSMGKHCSKAEESIDSVTVEETYATSDQKINTPEASDSGHSTTVDASVVNCDLPQDPGYADTWQSCNSNDENLSVCDRTNTNNDVTALTGEHCSKTEETINSVRSEQLCGTSDQKIEKTETKIPAASIRLPRKRLKPAVSLSLVSKKVKENLAVSNNPVCHSVQNSGSVSEQKCMEENDNGRSTPEDVNVVNCDLTQDPGYADIQQSDNCEGKNVSLCDRPNKDITTSIAEPSTKTLQFQKQDPLQGLVSENSEESCATSAQKIDTTETKISASAIRLPRNRVKPTVSLSLLNKKVKDNLTVCSSLQNSANISEPTCLEENGGGPSTPVDASSVVTCNVTQDSGYADILRLDNSGDKALSLCHRTNEDITSSTHENCSKTEESVHSIILEDLCPTSAQKIDTTVLNISAAPIKLPRQRIKPTVALSSVNKKVKENRIVEPVQNCSASIIDDNSTVQVAEKLQMSESIPDPHETPSSIEFKVVQEKNSSEFVQETCVKSNVLQTSVCDPKGNNEIPPDDVSVDAPVGEMGINTVTVSTPTSERNVVSDSSVVEKGKWASPPQKCSVNQLLKDCSPLNSFRSRFVRPKPLLESAARRNRTGSIGSASESDSEKKSLSSATTVSPPWKPQLKTSRTRLTHVRIMDTDKLANASSVSTDESEDERSSISRASTVSPPKKITRLDSYCGSDTSHSEFSEELSEEYSSPVKKSTKPEWISKRKEYLRRIIEIKKEISHKVSDGRVNKSRLTMFDLIYYNPATNPMKSVQEPDGKKSAPAPTTATENENRLAEESVDEPEALEDEVKSSTVPVPQVKVGPNGEIILDEQSLVIETTDAQKNWNDLQNSEIIMDYGNGTSTYNVYSKKRRTKAKDWNREETLRFYRALHTVGTDFLVMQSLFPKFTRKDLKDRYKKEERINRELVEKALRNPLTFDLTELQKEFELERLEEENRLTQPKRTRKRRGGFSRSCSLYGTLDSTDKGDREKPMKRKHGTLTDFEESHSQKKSKIDDATAGSECKPDGKETHSKKKRKAGDARTPAECTPDSEATHRQTKRKVGEATGHPECTSDSEATHSKKRRKDCDARGPSECPPDSDSNIALNGHVHTENSVPETVSQVKPTRSGRIPRPRIFEDFMTDDVEEVYEETEITEICEHVTVEDICDSEPVGDELIESANVVVEEDTVATCESENDDQNFVIAEDALTVHQNQVNLGSIYSSVKPGTLIVLATESPDNPGHQIFKVFMVSDNSQTLPVSVTNNQASPTSTTNSVEVNTLTDPVDSESSTNNCNSLQIRADSI